MFKFIARFLLGCLSCLVFIALCQILNFSCYLFSDFSWRDLHSQIVTVVFVAKSWLLLKNSWIGFSSFLLVFVSVLSLASYAEFFITYAFVLESSCACAPLCTNHAATHTRPNTREKSGKLKTEIKAAQGFRTDICWDNILLSTGYPIFWNDLLRRAAAASRGVRPFRLSSCLPSFIFF